jgi:hypothetical protein
MLHERTDIFRKPELEAYAEKTGREYRKEHPQWAKIRGKKTPIFRASSANACQRQICYGLLGETPRPIEIDGLLRVHDGDPHGASVIHWLRTMGYEVYWEEKRYRKTVKTPAGTIAVSGHVDGVVEAQTGPGNVGNIPYILECKGLSCFTLNNKSSEDIVNKGYRYQAQVYMWMSGIPRTLFAIKNKNNSQIRFWEYGYDEKIIKSLVRRWARIFSAVKEKDLLDGEYDQRSLECKWCRHNRLCWG